MNTGLWKSAIVLLLLSSLLQPVLGQDSVDIPALVKKIQPAVVVIITYDQDGEATSQGSGFFISDKGDIITNRHVLEGASRAEVKTVTGQVYPVKAILAEDKEGDLLRVSVEIPAQPVQYLTVSPALPQMGEKVLVIGNPLGLEQTVSDGIVSSVREIPDFGSIIQITAPVSPGSSGSPVVNLRGGVIGVASFQVTLGQNLNFAVPCERFKKMEPTQAKEFAKWQEEVETKLFAKVQQDFFTGLFYLLKEDYQRAFPYFEKAVDASPQYADAWFQLGCCEGEMGNYRKAIESFKQAIAIESDYMDAHNGLGMADFKIGNYIEAVNCFRRAIRIDSTYPRTHLNLWEAYKALGRYEEAIQEYVSYIKCLKEYPGGLLTHGSKDFADWSQKRYGKVLLSITEILRSQPEDARAWYTFGLVWRKLLWYEEAAKAFEQVVKIKPDLSDAHMDLGLSYSHIGRYQEALSSCKKAIQLEPDNAIYRLKLGVLYADMKRTKEAIAEYKKAIQLDPDYAQPYSALAFEYAQLGRYQEAIEAYKQVVRIEPNNEWAHFGLGGIYLKVGNKNSAIEEYQILKNLDSVFADGLFNEIYK